MRGLSLTQPWASLIALGEKRIETRSWCPSYNGPVAIHASKGFPRHCRDLCEAYPFSKYIGNLDVDVLPRGAIVAVAEIVCVCATLAVAHYPDGELSWQEMQFGDYSPGRYAWFLDHVTALPEPIPCKGALGLWTVPPEIEAQIEEQIGKLLRKETDTCPTGNAQP